MLNKTQKGPIVSAASVVQSVFFLRVFFLQIITCFFGSKVALRNSYERYSTADHRRRHHHLIHPQLPLMHPLCTPTQRVSIIAPSETDTDNWSQIFLGRTQRDLLFNPPSPPQPPKQLSTSQFLPSSLLLAKLHPLFAAAAAAAATHSSSPKHSPFHCCGEAPRGHTCLL